nr:hypothetical protein [uncultured Sphingomonas sp.]
MILVGLALLLMQRAPDLSAEATRAVEEQECRTRNSKDIVVCGQRKRNEKYRMPGRDAPFDPDAETSESVMRERMKWTEGGEAGPGSCSAIGPGGWTGCLLKTWREKDQQSANGLNRPKRKW